LTSARLVVALLLVVGCTSSEPPQPRQANAPESSFFASATIEDHSTVTTQSDGDLWPSCWSDDGNLYAANGDGKGFGKFFYDVAVNRITGSPSPANSLDGSELGGAGDLGWVWGSSREYNRKPTGMLCANGEIYLAIQDLNTHNFDDAPNASISKSTDHGEHWTWDGAPMFSHNVMTTLFFLDYGKDGVDNPDTSFVYVYGLDHNWRGSYAHSVPDPVDLYLARIPKATTQDATTWQYSTGPNRWSRPGALAERRAVLHDDRRIYKNGSGNGLRNLSVISQGGVVYDKPLKRYIYTSWTEYTFEFYEAPAPWGPWAHFMSKDFGDYPWTKTHNGGYATTIPSKFIEPDGRTMWVQSNVCPCGHAGTSNYDFTLRKLTLVPR
jgi:hypothetical protein